MKLSEEYREILLRVLEVESKMNEFELKIGWSLSDARCYHATLFKMIIEGLVIEQFRSNSGAGYLVTDEGKMLLMADAEPEVVDDTPIDTSHLFENIVGYDNVKEVMKASLEIDKPVHILLWGPPAIAKSLFLWDIEKVFGSQSLPLIGSATSKSGMWDLVAEHMPKIILIDELEKMHSDDQTALLSLLQYGRIIRAKVGRKMDLTLTCWCFATANRLHSIAPELLSRFGKFQLKEYTEIEFIQVVRAVLSHEEGCTADECALIAEQLVGKTHDIRDAIRVARIGKKTGIKRAIELLIK
jgi:Holliday junction DNA helicase RuvB